MCGCRVQRCRIPWCSSDVTDIVGEWWHSRFCDKHIYTIESDSCVYISTTVIDDYGGNFDTLIVKFTKRIRECTIRKPAVMTAYDVEKMRYVIFFDVSVLRKKFDDRDMIFIDKEVA